MLTDPYPVGLATTLMDPVLYDQMLEVFPPESLFKQMGGDGYVKLSLSEVNNLSEYRAMIVSHPLWATFHTYVKRVFIRHVFEALHQHAPAAGRYSARFEFSSMPAQGGLIKPHTDIASKVVTAFILVLFNLLFNNRLGSDCCVISTR